MSLANQDLAAQLLRAQQVNQAFFFFPNFHIFHCEIYHSVLMLSIKEDIAFVMFHVSDEISTHFWAELEFIGKVT